MKPIDFLPDRVKHQRSRRVRLRRHATLVVLGAAMLAGLGWANQQRVARADDDLSLLRRQHEQAAAQLAHLPDLIGRQVEQQVRLQVAGELGTRVDLPALLAELSRLLPPEASLTSLQCDVVEVHPPAVPGLNGTITPANGQEMRPERTRLRLVVAGVAPSDVDVTTLVLRMSSCPLLEDVALDHTRSGAIDEGKRKARSFQIHCLLAR